MLKYEGQVCPISKIQKTIGGKWKIIILWNLYQGTKRFGELRRAIDDITESMLTKQLRELETDGFINRRIYQEIPPKVEYSLSDLGKRFIPVLEDLAEWADENLD